MLVYSRSVSLTFDEADTLTTTLANVPLNVPIVIKEVYNFKNYSTNSREQTVTLTAQNSNRTVSFSGAFTAEYFILGGYGVNSDYTFVSGLGWQ